LAEKHPEFPPLQTHRKEFEYAVIAICLICIVIVLFVTQATHWGNQ
jgi:hypothetical protein